MNKEDVATFQCNQMRPLSSTVQWATYGIIVGLGIALGTALSGVVNMVVLGALTGSALGSAYALFRVARAFCAYYNFNEYNNLMTKILESVEKHKKDGTFSDESCLSQYYDEDQINAIVEAIEEPSDDNDKGV